MQKFLSTQPSPGLSSSPLAGLGEGRCWQGQDLWDLDPGDLGSDPSSASIHYATPGKALHLFELPFPQLYTELQQACRIIMMVDLGQRQLKKGAWGGWAQFGPLCWGTRTVDTRKSLFSHGS